MGWKYRKRVKILPGFYLNLSKSGMSATVGMKGFSVNMGKNGTYLNTGIPGTGIYDRVRLDNQPNEKPNPQNDNSQNLPLQLENDVVEIKSFQPELITSDGLFGLKETIVKAQEIKQELKEDAEKTVTKKNGALFLVIITHVLIFGIFIKWFRENYKARKADALEAKDAYENFKLDIDFNMDQSILNDYTILKNSFGPLAKSQMIWDITTSKSVDRVKERSAASTSVTRTLVNFSIGSLDYINTKYDAFKFHNSNGGDLYIYPGFIVMPSKQSDDFALIDFRDLSFVHHGQKFIETESVPSDAKIVGHTWQYVNKNGLPDKRYSYNPQIPIALYYEIVLKSSKGLYESFQFSNADVAETFCVAFEKYLEALAKMKWDKGENDDKAIPHFA
jgi:hypothetical protein